MLSMALASVLVALFATAGAISIVRNLSRRSVQKHEETPGVVVAEHPTVGGLGTLFGVIITLFYVDADLTGAKVLFAVGAVLAVAGTWMRHLQIASGRNGSLHELAAGVAAVGAMLLLTPWLSMPATAAGTLLMLMLLMTPAGISILPRSSTASNALPVGIVLLQLLLLLALVALGFEQGLAPGLPLVVLTVVLPVVGALVGALLYICPMPWRSTAAIATGVATCLCLGLVVAWAAARIAFGWFASERDCAAYLPWILAVPVFEWLRWHLALLVARAFPASALSEHAAAPGGSHPTWSLYLFTVVLGSIGIALWLSDSPAWSVWGLLPAWLVFTMTPLFLRPPAGRAASRAAGA